MFSNKRILVADDDVQLLGAVATAFEQAGAEVVRAESGAQLIERIADDGPFSLIVTDVSMPWMNGLHAMYSVRSVGFGTPVIIMTGLNDDRLPDQVKALGASATLLRKPFSLDELESAAMQVMSTSDDQEEAEVTREY